MKKLYTFILFSLLTVVAHGQFGYFQLKFYDSVGILAPKLKLQNTRQGVITDSILVKSASNFEVKRLGMNEFVIPYANLTGAPTVPTNNNQLTNGSGYITSGSLAPYSTKAVADGLYYPLSANPSNYLTSVPAQSFSSITGKPTTLSGYGITDAYPISGNPSSFLTGINNAMVISALGMNPVNQAGARGAIMLTTTGTSGASTYNPTSGVLNVPNYTSNTYTAGTGIGIASNVISNTLPDQTVVLTGANGFVASGTYPSFTLTQYIPSISTPSRALNSNFTVSATKQAEVKYYVTLSVSNPLLAGSSTASAFLEYSINGGGVWTTLGEATNTSSVALAVAIQITNVQTQLLSGTIPLNALVRIRSTTSGTASATITTRQQETF